MTRTQLDFWDRVDRELTENERIMAPSREYPRKNDRGETVWACCESAIGPICKHKEGRGKDG